jgi:hypothetical protein
MNRYVHVWFFIVHVFLIHNNQGRTNNFASHALWELVTIFYFSTADLLGKVFPEEFEELFGKAVVLCGMAVKSSFLIVIFAVENCSIASLQPPRMALWLPRRCALQWCSIQRCFWISAGSLQQCCCTSISWWETEENAMWMGMGRPVSFNFFFTCLL